MDVSGTRISARIRTGIRIVLNLVQIGYVSCSCDYASTNSDSSKELDLRLPVRQIVPGSVFWLTILENPVWTLVSIPNKCFAMASNLIGQKIQP